MSPRHALAPLLALTACDASFDVSRGELGPFRVAALGVVEGSDGQYTASAAIWSGLGMYHEEAPTLSWSLDGQALGEGWGVVVPASGELGLVATSPVGEALQARVEIAAPPPALSVSRAAVALGEDLSLEARQGATTEAVDGAAPSGQAERLTLAFAEEPGVELVARWMLAQDSGTLLEVDTLAADVLAEEITWDDGEVEARAPSEDTIFPTLALTLDGAGSNRWIWADAAIGEDEPLLRHEGRLLPVSEADAAVAASAGAYLTATLVAREDLLGVGLSELEDATVDGAPDLTLGDTLSCAPAGEPFRLAWIAEGRCSRPEVLGARVVLEVW